MVTNSEITVDRSAVPVTSPFYLKALEGELRPSRVAVLYIKADLTERKKLETYTIVQRAVIMGSTLLFMCIMVWLYLRTTFTRHLDDMTSRISAYIDGKSDLNIPSVGNHELAQIGLVINQLFTDFSEKRDALKQSEEQLRRLSDNLPGVMTYQIDTGTDGTIRQFTYISATVEKIHQATVEAAIKDANVIYGQIIEEDRPTLSMLEDCALKSFTTFSAEVRFRLPSGVVRWGLLSSEPHRTEHGHTVWDGIEIDITERKLSEEKLRISEEKYRSIVEQFTEGLLLADEQGRIIEWNNANETITGYSRNEVLGKPVWDVQYQLTVPEHRTPDLHESFRVAIEETPRQSVCITPTETVILRKDGTCRNVLHTVFPIVTRNVNRLASITTDITDRKRAEEDIRKALSEKETLIRELYHRTNNNMGVIISLLKLQANRLKDERLNAAFKEAENRIHSMALVHQKLHESKNLSRINLKDYIVSLGASLMDSFKIQQDQIVFEHRLNDVFVLIDTAVPCGLIPNELISNSIKFAFPDGQKGKIDVTLNTLNDGLIELIVHDDGCGMPDGFDPRQDAFMGLQTVFALAEQQLRGHIEYRLNHGTEWKIRFTDDLYSKRI